MFERYTEAARRVIFFGRWEASEFGSPYIETEHLLLGVLKSDPALVSRYLPGDHPYTSVRAEVERATPSRPRTSTSVDLPLSDEAKRVLAYAAEEAESLNQKHIDTEHLFLALLREKTTFAAKLLKDQRVSLSQMRKALSRTGDGLDTPIRASEWVATATLPTRFVTEDGLDIPIRLTHAQWLPRTGDHVRLETDEGSVAYIVVRVEWQYGVSGSDGSPLQQLQVTLKPEAGTRHE